MTTRERNAAIAESLCNTIRDEVMRAVEVMPEGFDGHEVRAFLADKFAHEVTEIMTRGRSARVRAYRRWSYANWRAGCR